MPRNEFLTMLVIATCGSNCGVANSTLSIAKGAYPERDSNPAEIKQIINQDQSGDSEASCATLGIIDLQAVTYLDAVHDLLAAKCVRCHGDSSMSNHQLKLNDYESSRAAGDAIVDAVLKRKMPKGEPLSRNDIILLVKWKDGGFSEGSSDLTDIEGGALPANPSTCLPSTTQSTTSTPLPTPTSTPESTSSPSSKSPDQTSQGKNGWPGNSSSNR